MKFYSNCEKQTKKIAGEIMRKAFQEKKRIFLLFGGFGVGKTIFVKGLAQALGIKEREIKSPSFAYVRQYQGNSRHLIHIDLYRTTAESVEKIIDLDYFLAKEDAVVAIEWAEHLDKNFPRRESLSIFLDLAKNNHRTVLVKP